VRYGAPKFKGVFAELADTSRFREVRVDSELGTIVWPNGADLDPMVLYCAITGREVPSRTKATA
jgi:hypothetical protein